MEKINGKEKSLRELLESKKYTLHYYQREYRWQRKHIEELINDLTAEFLQNYNPEHKRNDVEKYGIYFMGSIVLAGEENAIIDGQQRLSSLTLLLMYLNNRQAYNIIDPMIFSETFGTKSFNINVPERAACMTAIYNNKLDAFDTTNASESVKNLCARYNDIVELFPAEITDAMIPYFCDWLAEKIYFMQILAFTEQDAHKIFVTMNDRGLSLTPAEMLKGYLLSEITDNTLREQLNILWKAEVFALEKDTETFIKAWLRAQYAENNADYDSIGRAFHKWIRDSHEKLKLNTSADYARFINNFLRFAEIYRQIKRAEKNFSAATKYIFYNAQLMFTLQSQMLMAPICPNDDATIIAKKINLTARFIDLLINAKVTNYKKVDRNNIESYISGLTRDIRRLSIDELKTRLQVHYNALNYNPDDVIPNLKINQFTRKYIKNILARITSFIEEQTSGTPHYVEYMTTTTDPYEIEHILCDHFERFTNDFAEKTEFDAWRNSIGALLLLRKSINASLNDSDYPQKLVKYCSSDGNIYAASLGAQTYPNNPRFKKFVDDNNLSFEAFDKFGKAEIQRRIKLVVQLVNLIWNTEDFK